MKVNIYKEMIETYNLSIEGMTIHECNNLQNWIVNVNAATKYIMPVFVQEILKQLQDLNN